mmetsp:Transcript_30338/g.46409  ORF Transcript_30338/g.46409 Transcript_30338/m.46409 type:complete len:270 (+) Transcript_30338:1887-2696(+)
MKHVSAVELNLVMRANSGARAGGLDRSFDIKQLLPLLEIILTCDGRTFAKGTPVKDLVNSWLRTIHYQHISDRLFIESMFFILGRANSKQKGPSSLVDSDTVGILSDIRYQLIDEKLLDSQKSRQLHETFFKCLIQSTDFWINPRNHLKEVHATLNEQYWLLVKAMYTQGISDQSGAFPVHILISLMHELSKAETQDGTLKCCFYHSKSSKLLTHDSLKKADFLRRKYTEDGDTSKVNESGRFDWYEMVEPGFNEQRLLEMNEQQNQVL